MSWTEPIIYGFLFVAVYFQVFLFVTLVRTVGAIRSERARNQREVEVDAWPSVTIIVPAFNEERTIARTLRSLLELEYPKAKLSIAVVDDGSIDRTSDVARGIEDPRIMVLEKTNGGKWTALNHAIERTESEFVGCLDADSFVTRGALKTIMRYFDRRDVMAVCPSVQIHEPKTPLEKIQATEFLIGALTKKLFTFLNAVYVTPGPFSIYRRTVFQTLGAFQHGYGTEDMEMALRMQSAHMVIETAPDAIVYTVAPKTLPQLYRQRVRWVSGHLKNTLLSYRFMLFRKEYGDLGMFTLPFAFLSVVMALFFFGYALHTIGSSLLENIIRVVNSGIRFSMPTFEWFFIGSATNRILIYYLIISTILYLLLSSRLTHRHIRLSRGMLYFLLMYGFIAPLWLSKSLWNLVRAKEAPWR